MTHKEFKLIVKKEILESAGYERQAVQYRVGDEMVVDEAMFDRIQSGTIVERMTQEGFIRFDKYDFENEVSVTAVTVEYGIRRLGQSIYGSSLRKK
jgi:hypothetical protein